MTRSASGPSHTIWCQVYLVHYLECTHGTRDFISKMTCCNSETNGQMGRDRYQRMRMRLFISTQLLRRFGATNTNLPRRVRGFYGIWYFAYVPSFPPISWYLTVFREVNPDVFETSCNPAQSSQQDLQIFARYCFEEAREIFLQQARILFSSFSVYFTKLCIRNLSLLLSLNFVNQ